MCCQYFSNQRGHTIKNIAVNRQSYFRFLLLSWLSNLTPILKFPLHFQGISDSFRSHLFLNVVAIQWLDLASPSEKHFSILDISALNTLSVSLSIELWVSSTFHWKWWFNVWIIWLLGWVSGKQCNICNVEADGAGGAETVWMISGASSNAMSIILMTNHSKLSITF